MKKHLTLILLICCIPLFAQQQNVSVCDGDTESSFYTFLDRKQVQWGNSFYVEEYCGTADFNNKTYYKFCQKWANGNIDYLYLRDDDGRILQYESCCEGETVRYDEFFEPGQQWATEKKNITYTLLSYTATLSTPYCNYKGLMSIKAQYKDGTFYTFYYQQGNGFVGATDEKDTIISYIMPLG